MGCGKKSRPDYESAIANAAPDDPQEDAEGYITWNGRSPNAMNSADRESA